ncbi:pyridoxamine 5'-phosphate oxidase family protein [Nocardioides yefusunii]|uniref:Pyridoxamine 5'-phosphate oxidase family protein n=1 Tax=Nocardioides yefusunii TaxID=2500546 RepID=A0ABW1QUZ8_9ACTN|nr:pyridoxamine 5'-phosphate oxidase family protein [Nocardioides yefusunii]
MFGLDPTMVLGARGARHPHTGAPLGDLSREDCLELLRQHEVARVAFSVVTERGASARIVPVNYVVRSDTEHGVDVVEFRTTSASEMAVNAPGTEIALEIDHVDPATRSGWSVVVAGECRRDLDRFGETTRLGDKAARPWADGRRPMVLTLPTRRVTGKVVGMGDWDSLHL